MKVGKAICISIGNFDQNSSFGMSADKMMFKFFNNSCLQKQMGVEFLRFPIGIPIEKADGFI